MCYKNIVEYMYIIELKNSYDTHLRIPGVGGVKEKKTVGADANFLIFFVKLLVLCEFQNKFQSINL